VTITPGFQRSRKDQLRKRDDNAVQAVAPQLVELNRFGSPLLELGADRIAYASEISRLWSEAQDRFLKIGRYLVRAKAALPHGSFEAMIADELPFGRHVAWQLRTVATAVDGGRLVEDELPNSYATAFKLASLDDDVLDRAKAENVVRPNVTRAEVTSFVRRVVGERQFKSELKSEIATELRELERKLKKLDAERKATLARLAEIKRIFLAAGKEP
jgi:hypothetical protein